MENATPIAIENIKAARLSLAMKRPYFTHALFALNIRRQDSIQTLGVDMRWNLYYNQEFTEKLTREELEGVLVHEIMHLLRKHHIRARAIDAKKLEWNCAADAEINDDIISDSMKLPEGCVFPSKLEMPDNLLAEEYYAKILENPDLIKDYRDLNCGSCAHGISEEWEDALNKACEGLSEGEAELVRRQVAEAIAKHPGSVPGHLQRWSEELLGPAKVDWRKELFSKVTHSINSYKAGSSDYTFTRRSRRYHESNIVFPAMLDTNPKIAIVIDTSGSIGDKDLGEFLSEISGILTSVSHESVRVLSCDAEVHEDVEVRSIRELENRIVGGGGTDMGVAIEFLENDQNKPNICIVFTDGYTPWPESSPSFDTIAVVTTQESVPGWIKGIWLDGDVR